jgi:hypothetical protein
MKPLSDFEKNKVNRDGYNTICKSCRRITVRQRRTNDPSVDERSHACKQLGISRNRDYIYNFLQDKSCLDCGEARWQVLEFDHVRGDKLQSISWMVCRGFSLTNIQSEINKCDIRCGNCHRIKSTKELGSFKIDGEMPLSKKPGNLSHYRKRNREFVYDILKQSSCTDCGINVFEVLEFDHVRGEKEYSISYIVHHGMGIKTLKTEINKCDVRCVNCHRIKTIEQFGWVKATWVAGTPPKVLPPIKKNKKVVSDKTKKIMSKTAKSQNRVPPRHNGEDNNKSKLTAQQVLEIRSPESFNLTGVELAIKYNVSTNAISRVRKGITWRHLF